MPEGMKRSTISTVRWKIIEEAGRVIRKARQIYVKVCLSVEKFKGDLSRFLCLKSGIEHLHYFIPR